MKVWITAPGDESVGLHPTHVEINWPGLEHLDLDDCDPNAAETYGPAAHKTGRQELREDLLGLFSRWMDTGIRVEFEDELQQADAFEDVNEDAIIGEQVEPFERDALGDDCWGT